MARQVKLGPQELTGTKDYQATLVLRVLPATEVQSDIPVLQDHLAQLVLVELLEQWDHKVGQECQVHRDQLDRWELREVRGCRVSLEQQEPLE